LSEHLVKYGINQYAISETQKFGHMTYFWNGNRTEKFDNVLETYAEIKSDLVPFEQRPWMKAAEITDELIKAIESNQFGFLRANYPNGDMVGHTGNYAATIIGVETVDLQLARVIDAVKKVNGILVVTADHGNADEMYEKSKDPNATPNPKQHIP
jgi:2,3-bisphosphoglycerate-independent phosphoglycerate mutase